ncbi:hypothetical protein BurJ1DRAFT_2288 [Burkholderiales bacterium JOSHI_001]|nr:hypothetical protein BurJ1DRAFT_2288 [Burkholderiales bacterium JOSHI_001]
MTALAERLHQARQAWRQSDTSTRWWLAALAWLVLALLAPRVPLPGRDWQHMVVLDVTQSMNTRDMVWGRDKVSRLDFAKRALAAELARLPCGSTLGLGIFTEYRSLMLLMPVEVCGHYHELRSVIERIDARMSWAGASEVHKGLGSALKVLAGAADPPPSLLFVSDGHEAPPLRPGWSPNLGVEPGKVAGVVLGVGDDQLSPIPKMDPEGNPLGFWKADEVLQTDAISRGGTDNGAKQSLVDEQGRPMTQFQGTGTEHLSQLKAEHLRALAAAGGLAYRRLDSSATMAQALRAPELARWHTQARELRTLPAALALLCLLMAAHAQRVRAQAASSLFTNSGVVAAPTLRIKRAR